MTSDPDATSIGCSEVPDEPEEESGLCFASRGCRMSLNFEVRAAETTTVLPEFPSSLET